MTMLKESVTIQGPKWGGKPDDIASTKGAGFYTGSLTETRENDLTVSAGAQITEQTRTESKVIYMSLIIFRSEHPARLGPLAAADCKARI